MVVTSADCLNSIFVVDCRVTDQYTNAGIIAENTECEVIPRSLRLNSSSLDPNHELVKSGISLCTRSLR